MTFHNGAKVRQPDLVVRISGPQTSTQLKHRKVLRLFEEQDGRCFWCKKPMVLFQRERLHRKGRKGKVRLPQNLATLEHLDSRLSPERGKHNGERRIVLACAHCNHLRGRMEQATQPKEILWERSGRRPAVAKT
jgi:hypothetical protein